MPQLKNLILSYGISYKLEWASKHGPIISTLDHISLKPAIGYISQVSIIIVCHQI